MIADIDLLSLRGPTGVGQENDPDDVAALDFGLRRAGLYDPPPEYANEPQRYTTEPMIAAVKRLQEQNALKVDGYANPGGPTERVINNALLAKPRGANLLFEPIPPLRDSVGDGFANARPDVAGVQRSLGALGYGPEDPFDRPHGLIDATTLGGVTRFQRDRGLTPDGWMAPGGETERELKQSLNDLARAKGRDWVAYAQRAGHAETNLLRPLSGKGNTEDGATPAAWHGAPPLVPQEQATQPDRDDGGDGRVEPAQTAPGDWIVPRLFLGLPALLGIGEANRRRIEADGERAGESESSRSQPAIPNSRPPTAYEIARAAAGLSPVGGVPNLLDRARRLVAQDQRDGTKNEYIPPYVPNGPFRGPDPAQPPLDPSETRPAPYPAAPPDRMPDKVENIPPRVDPRDFIEVHPDQSDWISKFPIIVESRKGDPPLRRLNRTLAKPVPEIVKAVFPGARAEQRGGPTQNENEDYSEEFDEFRYKEDFGITSNAAGSFKDVNFVFEYRGVKFQLTINTVTTAGANPMPTTRENRQRAKMVLNAKTNTLIIDVDKLRADETVDLNAWSIFLESHLRYIKKLIDTRVQKKKIKPESDNYRFLDRFDPKQ